MPKNIRCQKYRSKVIVPVVWIWVNHVSRVPRALGPDMTSIVCQPKKQKNKWWLLRMCPTPSKLFGKAAGKKSWGSHETSDALDCPWLLTR